MHLTHKDRADRGADTWRTVLWIALIVGASLGCSRVFACATPFVALATIAGLQLDWRNAGLAVLLAWLGNQTIGFLLLGYPHTPETFAWGAAIGLAALAALACAKFAGRLPYAAVARIGLGFTAAFLAYEGVLYATALLLQSGTGAFSAAIVGRILAVNAAALAGLYAVHWLAGGLGLAAPRREGATVPAV